MLAQTSYLNANDAELTRQLASWDSPQRFVVTSSYQLPFGQGRHFLQNAGGVVGKLVEGWQLNGIYTVQSGVPITIANGESVGRTAYLPNGQRTLGRWFDTSAFRLRQTLEFAGASVLPDVRTQGTNNFDFSLYKDTRISEKCKLEFRAESFNLFNRAAFGAPNGATGSASFGVTSSQINFSRQLQFGLKLLW